MPVLQSIVNDIGNFIFGLAEATVYGSCKRRKQKFVMSFTIVVCTQINDIIQKWIRGQKYETYYHEAFAFYKLPPAYNIYGAGNKYPDAVQHQQNRIIISVIFDADRRCLCEFLQHQR